MTRMINYFVIDDENRDELEENVKQYIDMGFTRLCEVKEGRYLDTDIVVYMQPLAMLVED